ATPNAAVGSPSAQSPTEHGVGRRIWRDGLAWRVALYMGAQSAVFYMLSTWLAPLQVSIGYSAIEAGFHVMLLQLYGIIGSLITPLLFRGWSIRWSPFYVPIAVGLTALGFLFLPALLPLWLLVCGIACGSSLSVAIML